MQFWSSEIEKQVGDRVQTLLKDEQLLEAYKHFGADILRRSSIFHGLGDFLAACEIKGETCFEIGTWNALTSVVLSRHFRKVVTVDIAHNEIKHKVLEHLGITNVECLDISDNNEKRRIADRLSFDFAYLDGNHADDTDLDFEMTRKAGRVLFHEAWPFQRPVWNLVHMLPPHEIRFNGNGLAMWTKGVQR